MPARTLRHLREREAREQRGVERAVMARSTLPADMQPELTAPDGEGVDAGADRRVGPQGHQDERPAGDTVSRRVPRHGRPSVAAFELGEIPGLEPERDQSVPARAAAELAEERGPGLEPGSDGAASRGVIRAEELGLGQLAAAPGALNGRPRGRRGRGRGRAGRCLRGPAVGECGTRSSARGQERRAEHHRGYCDSFHLPHVLSGHK